MNEARRSTQRSEFAIGEFRIARVLEWEGPFLDPARFFPDFDPAVLDEDDGALRALVDPASGQLWMSFHTFVVRTPKHVILVDTCMGNHKERPERPQGHMAVTPYLANLAAAGLRPEDVDIVMCTHLHWDHVGWNTRLVDGTWVPTFPNARYVISRNEYEYWKGVHDRGEASMHAVAFADSVLPLARAGLVMLVDDSFELEDGVWLEAASGHTPGNVTVNLRSQGQLGVFPGDILHSPVQLHRPTWSTAACWNRELSSACRCALLERHAQSGSVVMPAHFPAPSAGRVVRRGGAFRFEEV